MHNLWLKRVEMMSKLQAVDHQNVQSGTPSSYAVCYESCFTGITNPKVLSNDKLARVMVNVFSVMTQVKDHRTFRTFPQIAKDFVVKMKAATSATTGRLEDNSESNKILKGVTLSVANIVRRYNEGGGMIPPDPALRECAYCGHTTVDGIPENNGVEEENAKAMAAHQTLVQKFDLSQNGQGPIPLKRDGKPHTRRPAPPTYQELTFQCHCSQQRCAREGTNIGSLCLSGCLKADGTRCEWKDGKCTCDVCKCPCKKAYTLSSIPRIQREIKLQQFIDGGDDEFTANQKVQNEGVRYMSEIWRTGALVAHSTMGAMKLMNRNGQATISKNQMDAVENEAFYSASAQMVPIAYGNLALTTQFEMQKQAMSAAPSHRVQLSNHESIDFNDVPGARQQLRKHRLGGGNNMQVSGFDPDRFSSFRSTNNRLTSMGGEAANSATNVLVGQIEMQQQIQHQEPISLVSPVAVARSRGNSTSESASSSYHTVYPPVINLNDDISVNPLVV